jgi:DNA-binding NtrC family response regulator/pSer/pThr/pTyr-binding forkhead associated (FHA) protein
LYSVQARSDDRTTASFSTLGDAVKRSHYLVVSIGGASSRVVAVGDGADLVFGRHASCEIVVDHDGVSRRHAQLRRDHDNITITDLDSRNGTLVNGAKITGARRLAPGDAIAIGPATAILATSTPVRRTRQIATVGELEERFDVEIDRATRYRRPLGVVMVRLDGPGDRVLAHVDGLLAELRRMDIMGEYGADELAIVLPETNAAATAVVAERVRASSRGVAVAAGTAAFPDDGAHAGELIAIARGRMRGGDAPRRAPAAGPDVGDAVVIDAMTKHAFELASRAAPTTIAVLVVGETGVGKEVIADAIHRLGPRARAPIVRVNCASLPEAIVESELFGHEKGAFTGAIAAKQGLFEAASGGTLFLDEVGELPLAIQPKLLRVLEQRTITRVGGTKEIAVDVRLICATHRDLDGEVLRGRFREDLYFRISPYVIPLPPLRDRRVEIAPLALRFARQISEEAGDPIVAIAPEALDALKLYDWPGNVRELRNVIERAIVLGGRRIRVQHLPERIRALLPTRAPPADRPFDARVAEVEREAVLTALAACNNNQTQAARKLGMSRFALIRLMQKHQIRKR